ncbi:ABC transporter permease [Halobaculum sp. MBLA0143]|uniref:ABC transporter permease n=1 Tax=Halobaculum sp. MBLA0143 TaxID=3079933 RepID=UPI0035263A80
MNLRKLLRIARWEASRTAGSLDRRAALLGLAALAVAGAAAGGAVAGFGTPPNEGLYPVAVDDDSPFAAPVADATALEPVPPGSETAVLTVVDTDPTDRTAEVRAERSRRGRAAASVYHDAVRQYNTALMRLEPNQSAAFPVLVTVEYVQQEVTDPAAVAGGNDSAGGGGPTGADEGTAGGIEDETAVAGNDATATPDGETTATDGSAADDETTLGTPTATPASPRDTATPEGTSGADDDGLGLPEVGGGGGLPDLGGGGSPVSGLFGGQSTGSPATISPPFPFASLILAFAFLVPMNFVVQAYGSTILDERIDRRGELLLVSPVSRLDIVAGKTLPYLAALVVATALVAFGVGGGLISVFAVLPVALVYLSATFLGAMFARSFKELTFVTVTITVFVTTYVFVPAIFTTVIPVALISPLTIVVRDLQAGAPVTTAGEFLFATGPFFVAAGMLFLLGAGIYREEDMFTQRPVPSKFLDALDAQLRGRLSVGLLSAALIPFVIVAELLGIALLVAFPEELAVPVLLLVVAVVEETAKSVGLFAAFQRDRFRSTLVGATLLGVISGVGFFLGEKATAVAQLVGLDRLPLGETVVATAGVGAGEALGLLLAPLALHTVAGAVAAVGASRGGRSYLLGLVAAIVIHYAYDFAVVVVFLG